MRPITTAFAAVAIFVLGVAAVQAGQLPAKIDFVRDVQPILNQHCVSCHGPELQMNGFRLDRRADALRGGTQTVIGPGNADGSRLYHRLLGTNVGAQMPPGRALADAQIEIIKRWIDEGADWPDEVSGEIKQLPADPEAVRLIAAIRSGDGGTTQTILDTTPRVAAAHDAHGTTPLMAAALYGDAALVQRLLAAGAPPDARNAVGASALMWAVPDLAKMRLLLDAGADANAHSDDRRSPLSIASGIVGGTAAARLLLDYGADPSLWRPSDVSPLREASRIDDVETFRLLLEYGASMRGPGAVPAVLLRTNCGACAALVGAGSPLPRMPPDSAAAATAPVYDPGRSARPTPIGPTPVTPATIRAAVERSLPLLQDVDVAFFRQTGCLSCHHNSLVAMAVKAARAAGYRVDEGIAKSQAEISGAYLESWRERTVQNAFIAGQADTISYLLFGLAEAGYTPDPATDAQAIWLLRRQARDGRWPLVTLRPPIESNDIEVTAVSMRAIQTFAPPARRAESAAAVDRARAWLMTAPAAATEERAFRLLGLSWAAAPREALEQAARALIAAQRDDGGWAQLEKTMTSDAYATGQALVALRASGLSDKYPAAYRKGLEFLLSTQFEDGTWFVETRSVPIQPYFDSGFPFGINQWISTAATGWATTALALAR